MSKLFNICLVVTLGFFLSGCGASIFNLGHSQSSCKEKGCDFSEAGVCMDPYYVYKNKKKIKKQAYEDIDCSKCGGEFLHD